MSKRTPKLEWLIGEDETSPLVRETKPDSASSSDGIGLDRLVILLLILILIGTLILVYRQGQQRIQDQITETILLETQAWATGDEVLRQGILDQEAPYDWAERFTISQNWQQLWSQEQIPSIPADSVRLMRNQGDMAQVEVTISQPSSAWTSAPYRETRFYRWHQGRWLRTAPVAIFWGEARQLETAYFRILHFAWDGPEVEAIATDLDAVYDRMRTQLQLSPHQGSKITIEILPERRLRRSDRAEQPLLLTSPHLLPIPVELNRTDHLGYQISLKLAERTLDETAPRRWVQSHWLPLVRGIHLWLAMENSSHAATWKPLMVRSMQEHYLHRRPPGLTQLSGVGPGPRMWPDQWSRDIVAASLVEYIEASYGPQGVRDLIDGFGHHTTRNRLFPGVFGKEPEEVDQAWIGYLTTAYGLVEG